jgi:hypothetical protein
VYCHRAGVDLISNNGGSIEDVDKFQRYFDKKYQIVLYQRDELTRTYSKIYQGPHITKKKLFLRIENNHYDAIDCITAFLGSKGYCYQCLQPYHDRYSHKCKYVCDYCNEYHQMEEDKKNITCEKCYRTFISEMCYVTHKSKKKGKPMSFRKNVYSVWCYSR